MTKFICPVSGCEKELSRLQVMHFRSAHECDPIEWVEARHGSEVENMYGTGVGAYVIADEYEWLSSDMVTEIVETRTHSEVMNSEYNPMKREKVAEQFFGAKNPSRRADVRENISEALTGHTVSEETREKISRKNKGNEIGEEHRKKISAAASKRDTSYMQTEEYRQTLSESLRGRKPTYPTSYEVDELSHPVRSSWEEEIGKLLVENDISYEYEEEFQLSVGSYYPDFVVGDTVVEVKGFSNERSVDKATAFLDEFPNYTYVVVGDEIPCDRHISWDRRSDVLEVLNDD